jgi:hypothetical protein
VGKVLAMVDVRRTIVAGNKNTGIRTLGAAMSTLATDASSIQGETIRCATILVMAGAGLLWICTRMAAQVAPW